MKNGKNKQDGKLMRVENYKEQPSGSKIVAVFDVYIPAVQLTLRNLKIINKKDGGKFIAFPSFSKDGFNGKTWVPYISFSKEKGDEFLHLLWQELKTFVREPIVSNDPPQPSYNDSSLPF